MLDKQGKVCEGVSENNTYPPCVCVFVFMPVRLADGQPGPPGCQADGSLTVSVCVLVQISIVCG